MKLMEKQELSGPFSAKINIGNKSEGPWTSPELCCNIDMGEKGEKLVSPKNFCSLLSLVFVKLDLEKFSLFFKLST